MRISLACAIHGTRGGLIVARALRAAGEDAAYEPETDVPASVRGG